MHEHPELSHQEKNTAAYIAKALSDMGLKPVGNIGGYGVTAVIEGNGPGKCVGLRADFDALPITECTGLPFSSKTDGVMENPHVDAMFGQHVWPALPLGKVGIRNGAMMASSDRFFITIRGKNSHGSAPEDGIDAIVIASYVIAALQTIVSRNVGPLDSVPEQFELVRDTIEKVVGPENLVIPENSALGGEDFSFYCEKVPSAFYWLGCTAPGQKMFPIHNGGFYPAEEAFPIGMEVMVESALKYLAQ